MREPALYLTQALVAVGAPAPSGVAERTAPIPRSPAAAVAAARLGVVPQISLVRGHAVCRGDERALCGLAHQSRFSRDRRRSTRARGDVQEVLPCVQG